MPAPAPAPAAPAAAPSRPPPARPTATAETTYPLRLGAEQVAVPVGRAPDGSLAGDLTAYGIRRGGLLLTGVEVGPDGGWAVAELAAPFVRGRARLALDADGRATGRVTVDATVAVLGATLVRMSYAEEAWAGAPLPVPAVAVDGAEARVSVDPATVRGTLTVDTGTGARPVASLGLRIPLGDGPALPDVRDSVGTPLAGDVAQRLATLLAQPVPGVVVHTDPPANAAAEAAGVPGLAVGRHLYFGRNAYDPAGALDLLVRLVGQALAGLPGPPTTPPDPAAEDVVPQQATSFTPPAPDATVPPVPAGEAPTEPAAEPAPGAPEAPAPEAAVGAAAPPEPGGTGVEPPAAEVELLIPPAPSEPGPAARQRMGGVGAAAGGAATAAAALPTAAESTGEARAAVTPPGAEAQARAEAALAEALGRRPEPNPALVALCEHIRRSIREKRPVDEDELVEARPQDMARDAGTSLNTAVQGDASRVQGSYDAMGQTPPPAPVTPGTPVTPPPATVAAPPVNAPAAAPDPVPAADVSLDADRAAVDQRVTDANIERPSTEPIQQPPFSTVREGRDELGQMSETAPAEVLAQQDEALNAARGDMAALQQQALRALTESRSATVTGSTAQQGGMVGSEAQTRESVGRRAQEIFDGAQTRVNTLLEPLSRNAMATWDAGVQRHSTEFKQSLDRVKRWVDDRHSGLGGAIVAGWDAVTGLPGWVVEEYDRAERLFGDRVCELLLEISASVESVIAAAEAVIEEARRQISELFASLPAELQGWAAEQQAQFAARLDGLHNRVVAARDDFTRDISQRAVSAVAEVQRQVEELRNAARGVIGQIVAAIDAFLEDPVKAIIDGLLNLVGIPPASFWALVARIQQVASDIADDPMRFVNNLVAALKLGFENFFTNFPQHLLQGFFDWLFSALASVGVALPPDFSPGSIVTFALQLMGITWPRVREILVRHVGERNVALVEQVWQFVSVLIQRGPAGIFEMLKERLDPAQFVQQILQAAVEYVVQALIERVAMRVVMLFNPAGAVVQAIELAYRVLKWVFENAARIFRFVETVVNGIANVIAGDIGGTAAAIEMALASLLPPVIDFLAGFAGLGDLPLKIADVIKGLQAYVYEIMDAVIGFLAERGRALLQSLGLGGGAGGAAGGDQELGKTVTFAGGGESHREWVQRNGTQATLMVASRPKPITEKLDEWQGKLPDVTDEAKRADAASLLPQARALAVQAEGEADALAPAYDAAAHGAAPAPAAAAPAAGAGGAAATAPATPSDDPLEAKEQSLGTMLSRLFEIFDAGGREQALADIRVGLPPQADLYRGSAVTDWRGRIDRITFTASTNPATQSPLFAGVALPAGTTGEAATLVGTPSVHEELVGYFLQGVNRRGANTAEFRDYAFAPTRLRPRFLGGVAQPVPAALKAAAQTNLQNSPEKYRQKWLEKIAQTLEGPQPFDPRAGTYGRFSLPDERPPDHSLYEPRKLVEDDDPARPGYRRTRYETVTGQTFTVHVPNDQGLAIEVKGDNLMVRSGRGVTEDSPNFIPGQNLNRAHIIANEFTGSGYQESLNLVTTSAHYNQIVMRGAERQIGRELAQFAEDNSVHESAVRMSMTVSVRQGGLYEQKILDDIAKEPWYAAHNLGEVADVIRAKLAGLNTSLRRVLSVQYQYTFTLPGTAASRGGSCGIGVDLWLLLDYKPA